MKRFIILIIIFLIMLPLLAFSQQHDRGIFTNNAQYDTLGSSDDSLEATVNWSSWSSMKGSLKIWGKAWLLSGASRTVTVNFRMLNATGIAGDNHSLGDISLTDSSTFEFNVANETWWNVCKGYEVSFVPDATGSSVRFKARELSR